MISPSLQLRAGERSAAYRARMKTLIVWVALRRIIPALPATCLIRKLGLVDA